MDPLVEQVCLQKGITLVKKSFFVSMWFLISRNLKPPVLLLDGNVIATGKVLSKDELNSLVSPEGGIKP